MSLFDTILRRNTSIIHVDSTLNEGDLRRAFHAGQADVAQKFLYSSEHGAQFWDDIAFNNFYGLGQKCLDTINDLVSSTFWRNFVTSGELYKGNIIFGAGAPNKDIAIINGTDGILNSERINNNGRRIEIIHCLLDSSSHMLKLSRKRIQSRGVITQNASNTMLYTVETDFLDADGIFARFARDRPHTPDGKYAFFIPGGTIGNIREDLFFLNAHRAMRKNDVLIVGADFIGQTSEEESINNAKNAYNHPIIRDFTLSPIRAVLNTAGAADILTRNYNVDLAEENTHSDITGAITIEISTKKDEEEKIILARSNRYFLHNFIEYASRRFDVIGVYPHGRTFIDLRQATRLTIDELNGGYMQVIMLKRDDRPTTRGN